MGKSKIVIVDTDTRFLFPLEMRFLIEMDDDVDLEIISDSVYFETYFSQPRKVDVLVINENMYSDELHKHNIENFVVMLENNYMKSNFDSGIYTIYKYTSIEDIYNLVISLCENEGQDISPKDTKVVLIASASGGTGKTTIAMGICQSLANRYKNVLYINAENMNAFQYWMNSDETIPVNVSATIGIDKENAFTLLKQYIKKEGFD